MLPPPLTLRITLARSVRSVQSIRRFTTPSSSSSSSSVRIFDPITRNDDFHTTTRLSTTANTPPNHLLDRILLSLMSEYQAEDPGVMFCEVELDAMGGNIAELAGRYMISTLPTLLTFKRGEPIPDSRWTDIRAMSKKERIAEWIEEQAKGNGDVGNVSFGGLFR
ncbi:hypothetical protein BZA77DRAFT_341399 [Pyronema omphalodes]|nr:hypothetical protein BZA77DRAFT_341399 [Pyronema omphalodes]